MSATMSYCFEDGAVYEFVDRQTHNKALADLDAAQERVAALETLLAEWQEDYALEHKRARKWRRKYKRLADKGTHAADELMPCGCGAGWYTTNKYNSATYAWGAVRVCFKCGAELELGGEKTITDGFGNTWPSKCPKCGGAMQVVRPGYAKCQECDE